MFKKPGIKAIPQRRVGQLSDVKNALLVTVNTRLQLLPKLISVSHREKLLQKAVSR